LNKKPLQLVKPLQLTPRSLGEEGNFKRCLQPTVGWGALYEGRPTSSLWSSSKERLHISCLEMRAVFLALKTFHPHMAGHHIVVLFWMNNMAVVSFINRQGGLRLENLHTMAKQILLWVHANLCS